MQACSRCRNAKIKCDGKLPACSSCEKNGRAAECTSTNDQFARGKERSYVSTLETRIDKLQTKLEEARARKPSVIDIPEDESAAPSRRPSYQVPEPLTPTTNKFQRRREVSAIDDLVSDFGFLSVNATARDFYGFTTAMSYARLILSACSKDPLPEGTTKALPPRYTATALIQFYLNNVFVLLPAFDEATFYASVDNIYLKDFRKADPLDHWMVRMVLAIASASRSEQQGDQCYLDGIGHVCAALEHAESVLHPGNISGVQALVLLTEYAMLDPHHFDSWNLIGAASRAMTDLGLHQDPPKGTAMPRSKLELRRRVFHCIYALDRSTSLVQTRAFSFSDDSAKVKVPFQKQASAPTSPQAGPASQPTLWLQSYEQALDLITLRKLQSTWYTDLFQSGRTRWDDAYPYLWDTCDSIRRWFENLSPSATPNMRAFFELDLLYSYVYVLSPSPRVPVILPFAQKLIFEYCIRYAELMLRLISDHGHTVPLTFYDAMRVYMTGRQFLDVLQHNTEMLLNGLIPPHPEVKPTTAPPPPMPVAPLPPGETVQCFNTVRSINCIKQITECLARFGIRWGYMRYACRVSYQRQSIDYQNSWNQRYQTETSGLLDELNQRLGELDEMNGNRRPSMWQQQGSTGSIPSSNGSISYHSPPQGVAHPSAMYQPPPPPPQMPQIPSFNEAGLAQRISPPQFHQQPNLYPQQQYQVPQNIQFSQPHQQYQHPQPQSYQQFNVNDPAFANPAFSQRPSQQFATWTGYGGVSVHDKPDDENAVPPKSNPWDLSNIE